MLIKNIIDEVRQDCRLTKVELANKAGMSKQNLYGILKRGSDRARVTTIVNLLDALGYEMVVIGWDDNIPAGCYQVTNDE